MLEYLNLLADNKIETACRNDFYLIFLGTKLNHTLPNFWWHIEQDFFFYEKTSESFNDYMIDFLLKTNDIEKTTRN